ncbi:hypothetical protein RvY_00497 [Ramazzottius varieornatus]|uniref:Uncharacterized protein n=1 Tax=Ramazzottius varieornatus TaxID=947166 RepID=A0A1D1UCZ3_RAMVA|nr:hypothetical protein RvY_00497 [Ramazzottius varieornatus]
MPINMPSSSTTSNPDMYRKASPDKNVYPVSDINGHPSAGTNHDNQPSSSVPSDNTAISINCPDDRPPPYTLIRGRRMRFFTQNLQLQPTETATRTCPGSSRLFSVEPYAGTMDEDNQKRCCGPYWEERWCGSGPTTVNIRWFIVVICFIALCCVVVGIVLGSLKGANEFTADDSLTIALLLIGVGIILLAVSGVAWRLTAKQGSAPSLRHMLGFVPSRATSPALQSFRPSHGHTHTGSSFHGLLRTSFGRNQCPAAPYYDLSSSSFHIRPPPPSYHATMADYRQMQAAFNRNQPSFADINRTPPPQYRAVMARVLPAIHPPPESAGQPLDQLPTLHQASLPLSHPLPDIVPAQPEPPSYRLRPALRLGQAATVNCPPTAPRRNAQSGHVNAIFNDNYVAPSTGGAATRSNSTRVQMHPKIVNGTTVELLAQL